jgi:hypothetical protein
MLADSRMPLWVPLFFTAWGAVLWFAWGRRLLRDPHTELHHMAESQLKWGTGIGNDAETQFKWLWRFRWFFAVISIGYAILVVGAWVAALRGR